MFRKKDEPKVAESTVERLKEAIGDNRRRWTDAAEQTLGIDDWAPPAPAHHVSATPQIQEQAIAQILNQSARPEPHTSFESGFEPQPGGVATAVRELEERCQRIETTIEHIGVELRRLAAHSPQPASTEPHRSLSEPYVEPHAPVAVLAEEPKFPVAARPISVVFSNVPDFQGLMDMQRSLSAVPVAENSAVVEFEDSRATFELVLREPATTSYILDTLERISGRKLEVVESLPEGLRLHLGFADTDTHGPGLHPERWAKS